MTSWAGKRCVGVNQGAGTLSAVGGFFCSSFCCSFLDGRSVFFSSVPGALFVRPDRLAVRFLFRLPEFSVAILPGPSRPKALAFSSASCWVCFSKLRACCRVSSACFAVFACCSDSCCAFCSSACRHFGGNFPGLFSSVSLARRSDSRRALSSNSRACRFAPLFLILGRIASARRLRFQSRSFPWLPSLVPLGFSWGCVILIRRVVPVEPAARGMPAGFVQERPSFPSQAFAGEAEGCCVPGWSRGREFRLWAGPAD